MTKKNKTDYFTEIKNIAELSASNLREFTEKVSTGSLFSYTPNHAGREKLLIIEQDLKKDYFTPIEREDILMFAILGNEMYDETENLLRVAAEIVITDFSREISSLSDFIIGGIKNITEIMTAFSKFPKTGDLSDSFRKHTEICDKFDEKINSLIKSAIRKNTTHTAVFSLHIITGQLSNCLDCCKKTVNYTRCAAIKNS